MAKLTIVFGVLLTLLAVIGFVVYVRSLRMMDQLLADHRDTLSETLCKV